MKEFKELQSVWVHQSLHEKPKIDTSKMESRILSLKKKQHIVPAVLGVTILLLLIFLFSHSTKVFNLIKNAILLMSFSLLVRIVVEVWTNIKLNRMNVRDSVATFHQKLNVFEKTRRRVHFIVTPIVLVIYIVAFYSLMPFFKEHLSAFMYTYVIWSSIVFFTVLILFKLISIPKELKLLNSLINEAKAKDVT